MPTEYYDPIFYISSNKMPFTIRIEIRLKDEIDESSLSWALNEAIKRYPYFAIEVKESDGVQEAIPNSRPMVAYKGPQVHALGSKELNYHLFAASYLGNEMYFYGSHVVTDGSGFFPFLKTTLYYYLCRRYATELDPTGFLLSDDAFFDDELGNPYPEQEMRAAAPLCANKQTDYFRLRDGGYVTDDKATVYRFKLNEAELMRFSYDNDGSPCALISSMMTKAIWSVHPEAEKDIVSAISFNMRPGLKNAHSYRMLCSALKLHYPARIKTWNIKKLCTCSRGMVTLQSQPENVLSYAQKMRERVETINLMPDSADKKRIFGQMALDDASDNTFSVSYVGKINLGSIEPYIDSIYNITDGSTQGSVFIEISAVNGCFDIAFLQGFSSDVYYRAFLKELERNGLSYREEGSSPLNTPKMIM